MLLDEAGFEITRRKDFSLRDNPAGLATSLAPGLDPMARLIRGVKESNTMRLVKNLAYLGLVVASLPFALLEAACGAGSTIMVEAREKDRSVIYAAAQRLLPAGFRRWLLHFDTQADLAVASFASQLPKRSRVLDAGAGESRHRPAFSNHRYLALDLAVGDTAWNYAGLDILGDLARLPFADSSFDAALNIVTLEHVQDPQCVIDELARVVRPGGQLLFVVPHEWEVHQSPHDYFRYTATASFSCSSALASKSNRLEPVGRYFRLMSRRLLNGLQFFPGPFFFLAALVLVPLALLAPLFEPLDRRRDFTLGYIANATKP